MREQWTPERITWWRNHYEDVDRASLKRALLSTLDALEDLQAELDAAREVVEAARMVGRFDEGDFSDVVDAVVRYDAARAGQEES